MTGGRGQRMPTAVSPSGGDQPPADGVAYEGGRLMNVQLPHQVDAMRLDGFDAQAQVRCYLLRRLPLSDALDNLALARGQRVQRQSRAAQIGLHDCVRDSWTQIDRALESGMDGLHDIHRRLRLQDIAHCAGLQSL